MDDSTEFDPATDRSYPEIELLDVDARYLAQAANRFRQSDDFRVLFEVVAICGQRGIQVPGWVGELFDEKLFGIKSLHHSSWDDALGPLHPKGKRLPEARKRLFLRGQIRRAVQRFLAKGQPIDDGLWELVADAINNEFTSLADDENERVVSPSLVKSIWYDIQRYPDALPPIQTLEEFEAETLAMISVSGPDR